MHFGYDIAFLGRELKFCQIKHLLWTHATKKTYSDLQVQYKTIQDIDFTSARSKKKQLDEVIGGAPATPSAKQKKLPNVKEPTAEELSNLFTALDASGRNPALLSLVPGFAGKFRPKALDKKYPKVLSELYNADITFDDKDSLLLHCANICDSALHVTPEKCDNCEMDTRTQANCKQWFSFQTGRVTASRAKAVCRTLIENPSRSLLKDICYPRSFSSKPTQWGCDHEKEAKKQYVETMMECHENCACRDSGLVINPEYPYIGATPDGIASCLCCGEVILEIKCPYCARDSSIDESVTCLEKTDGKLSLDRSHSYYYQIQCQMLLCDKEFCDFIVWTSVDFFSERIAINSDFCHDMVEKSKRFFKAAILPELVGKLFSKPMSTPLSATDAVASGTQSAEPLICVCKTAYKEGDAVIGCDNENCPYVWLHFRCINIKRAPKGDWFCQVCRKLPQFKKSRSAKK